MILKLRWIRRHRWRRSHAFDNVVEQKCTWLRATHGDKALDIARAKLTGSRRASRKWVWQAVVARLEAEAVKHEAAA
ncbi:hypothetical protein PX554_19785 [Sphingomonas sp. H39-1-10]|uniref:hypothetical protein n=1 Tax=Sphingomonas pollutisoli TaxID=3030829 RepID=UPI0023BA0848|nr:hypothetical protein [Sphingomonas pollutisoli]MDF0490373.1 hypothetical protein [Sphingomonas pollutisoli]